MRIGFIGLGNMGMPMAANLAAAGHEVTGYDVSDVRPESLNMASSAAAAATGRDAVITMLPDGGTLRQVAADVIPVMAAGSALIDCSTVDVDSARDVAAMAGEAGLLAVDAPVSGGVGGARSGSLTFMAGGPDAGFALAAPLFEIMGAKAVHCGGSGAGQAAKICNNMILGATMVATCEAFLLAEKLGLDAQAFYDIASVSSGQSWSMTSYCPVPGVGPETPADRGYQGGFAAALMLKDLRLAMEAAAQAGADTPMGAKAAELYERYAAAGEGGSDFSGIIRMLGRGA